MIAVGRSCGDLGKKLRGSRHPLDLKLTVGILKVSWRLCASGTLRISVKQKNWGGHVLHGGINNSQVIQAQSWREGAALGCRGGDSARRRRACLQGRAPCGIRAKWHWNSRRGERIIWNQVGAYIPAPFLSRCPASWSPSRISH